MGGKGSHRTCVICGVKERRNSSCPLLFAQFPLDEIRCKSWLRAVGNKDLVHLPIEKLNQLRHVCRNHFRLKDINKKGNRLRKRAIPVLNLTVAPLTDAQLIGFPQHMFENKKDNFSPQVKYELHIQDCMPKVAPSGNQGPNEIVLDSFNKSTVEYPIPNDTHETDKKLVKEVEEIPLQEKKVCRICLRAEHRWNKELNDALIEYYDELVYYDTYEHGALRVCLFCEHLLRRAYNFRQKCRRAHILLKTWSTDQDKNLMYELHKMLPQHTIGTSNKRSNIKVYSYKNNIINAIADYLGPSQQASSNTKNENKIVSKDSNNSTLDLKSYVRDFLKYSELDDGEVEPEIVEFEPENDQFKSENVQFGSENEQYEPEIVQFESENIQFENDNGNHDIDAYVEIDNDSLDTNRSVDEDKEKNEKASTIKRNIKKKGSQPSPEECLKRRQKRKNTFRFNKHVKKAALLKDGIVSLMDRGELQGIEDLGVTLDKELFLKIFEYCPHTSLLRWGVLKGNELPTVAKIRGFLLSLLKRYNPKYETIFEVERLTTDEQKLAEFISRQHTKEYLEAHHKCTICYKVFEVQGLLDFHKNWHDPKSAYVCSICSMSHKSEVALKNHHITNHQFLFRCKQCPLFTNSPYRMKTHYHNHLGAEYQCCICKKNFKNKSTMENHKRVHTTKHLCPLCAKNLQSAHGLHMHLKLKHSNESPEIFASAPSVKCNQCGAAFYSEDTLKRHVSLLHKPPKPRKTYDCFFCKEEFDSISALYRHRIKSEHRGRRLRSPTSGSRTCPLCEAKVPSTNSLALYRHYKLVHPSEPYEVQPAARNYLCEHCGKGFRARLIYEDHLNTHTGEKPYECSECGARFAGRLIAKTHVESHGLRKHRCDQCPKMYKTASALCRHARVHTGMRNYICPICSKAFSHSDSLKLHLDSVHYKIRKIRNKRKQSRSQNDDNETTIPDQMKDEAIIQDQIKDEAMFQDHIKDESATQDHIYIEHMFSNNDVCSPDVVSEEIVSTVDDDSVEYDEF